MYKKKDLALTWKNDCVIMLSAKLETVVLPNCIQNLLSPKYGTNIFMTLCIIELTGYKSMKLLRVIFLKWSNCDHKQIHPALHISTKSLLLH